MCTNSSQAYGGLEEILDKQHYDSAVLMGLSKAFDLFPHALILAKLSAYGLSANACDFLALSVVTFQTESRGSKFSKFVTAG